MNPVGRRLTPRQQRGLNKIGDALIPGDADLPPFSATGCAVHADRILAYLSEQDRHDLRTALTLFSFLPGPVLVLVLKFLELAQGLPGAVGALVRMGRVGIKGLVVSLYYSGETGPGYQGPNPAEVIGFEVSVYLADLEAGRPQSGQ
ncbi:MAG: hypothetical protein AB1896_16425 [Thermodesulfobacteriota bacterium]